MSIAAHDRFRVIHQGIEYEFEVAEEGGYIASVPEYPSCISQGETFEEALEHIQEGLIEILATARELGLEIPETLEHIGAARPRGGA